MELLSRGRLQRAALQEEERGQVRRREGRVHLHRYLSHCFALFRIDNIVVLKATMGLGNCRPLEGGRSRSTIRKAGRTGRRTSLTGEG